MSAESDIILQNNRLKVEVAAPGTGYRGTRFDWTGFITQVTLDGTHTYCVPESYTEGQGTGGVGLCNEFGIDMAIGYEDARPGDLFLKLGVGLLQKPDTTEYSFTRPYPIVFPAPVEIQADDEQVRFTMEAEKCRGYAARLTKTLCIQENRLEADYLLENTGSLEIETTEYVHNFIGINSQNIGPAYCLRFPSPIQLENLGPMLRPMLPKFLRKILPEATQDRALTYLFMRRQRVLSIQDEDISFRSMPKQPFYCRLVGAVQSDQPQWRILHMPSGVGLKETDSFAPGRVAVWGTTHVLSAEIFMNITLKPGESKSWTRTWEFFNQ
jgi:hypothetical protein